MLGRSVDKGSLERAQGVAKAVGEYFHKATEDRMQGIP